ncbi:MAG: hypothetical protein RL189_3383 [Pseudomonadota bacterium]|jgi:tetratricopeptide (TPR) repeat protein
MFKKTAVLLFITGTAVFIYRNLQTRSNPAENTRDAADELSAGPTSTQPSSGDPIPKAATDGVPQNSQKTSEQQQNAGQNVQIGLGQFDAYAHFQMGNYEGAVSLLRTLIKQCPGDELIRKNLATALLALGFFKLQKKEIAEAESAFDESARLGNADARKALAALKLRQGQIETARELLEDISKAGADPESFKILIDLALSQDEIERADDLLNRMNESLLRRVSTTQQPVSPELTAFIEVRRKRLVQKKNFLRVQDIVSRQGIEVSYSTPELRSNAETVARAMENVMARLNQLLGPLPSHARLRAWLVPTNDFNSFTNAPAWAAAVFDGYIRIPVGRTVNGRPMSSDTLERLAQHETTHAYVYAFCGDVLPSWIGEGLAQIYEGRSVQQSSSEILRTAGRKGLQSFEAELENPFTLAPVKMISRLYARSHLIVNSMSREGGGVGQTWQRVLSAVCVQRRPLPDVLQEQFNAGTLTELWGRYFPPATDAQ